MKITKKTVNSIVKWIKETVGTNRVIVGISGGTDSTVVSKLCVEALGKENVIGVLMPNGNQHDLDVAVAWATSLAIRYYIVNIEPAYKALCNTLDESVAAREAFEISRNDCFATNTPARLRMTTLYGIAAMYGNSRVVNTCNLSEDFVGYSTKFGDSAGDFAPIAEFTKTEVRDIGRVLGIPEELIVKVPEDGMSGLSDEDKLGFTYEVLDRLIRHDEIDDEETKEKIVKMHKANLHKLNPMPKFNLNLI